MSLHGLRDSKKRTLLTGPDPATPTSGQDLEPEVGRLGRMGFDQALGKALPSVAWVVVSLEFLWLVRWYWEVISRGGEGWQTGDWLINFAGGAVRRGAFGEFVFRVVPPDGVLITVFIVQISFLFALCLLSLFLYLKSPRTAPWFALTLSPAFLLFPFLSPEGGLRKELIGLTALAWLAVVVRMKMTGWTRLPVFLLFVVGLSAHEVTAFMVPAFVFLVWQYQDSRISLMRKRLESAAYLAVTAAALVFYMVRPGSRAQVEAVCGSWRDYDLWQDAETLEVFCNSSLGALDGSTVEAVRATAANFPGYLSLVSLIALAAVPLYLIRLPRRLLTFAAVQSVVLVPLFVVGTDYGRWIFVYFAALSLVTLGLSDQLPNEARRIPNWSAVLFVSLWSLPYAGTPSGWSIFSQISHPLYQNIAEYIVRVSPWLG